MNINNELSALGLKPTKKVYRNLIAPELVEMAVRSEEGYLADNGALVVRTGKRTGRSPGDRFIVKDETTVGTVDWNNINIPVSEELFDKLYKQAVDYISSKDIFVFDGFSGTDTDHRLPLRVVTTHAWHSLFAHTLFVRPKPDELAKHVPSFHIINAYGLEIKPNEVFVAVNFKKKVILVIGTGYGGEMKKGMFAVMNYLLPERGVFPMHCSANVGKGGDVALFFGLSGTGKTTLSADQERRLIGDDEHGWSDKGVFNFEGGCYAKVIRLSSLAEPQIYNAIRFGSILENVITREDRSIDYDSDKITENTRATYPVEYIPNCVTSGIGGHPKNIFFLTCDAFGVLPPIAKLTPSLAMYHFISGYTAKVAGTEVGITEPKATFSACFGAPFLPHHPGRYATMLGEQLKKYGPNCWLVNTGWSGGAYGIGRRMKISLTRSLLTAALDGKLDKVNFLPDPIFKVLVPSDLTPKDTWKDASAYNAQATKLAGLFIENFKKYRQGVSPEVIAAGPSL